MNLVQGVRSFKDISHAEICIVKVVCVIGN